MDLKKEGQRSFVTAEFKPNGGRNYQQLKSYNEKSALCYKHIFKLLTAGKAVILPWDSLSEEDKMQVHVNTLQLRHHLTSIRKADVVSTCRIKHPVKDAGAAARSHRHS